MLAALSRSLSGKSGTHVDCSGRASVTSTKLGVYSAGFLKLLCHCKGRLFHRLQRWLPGEVLLSRTAFIMSKIFGWVNTFLRKNCSGYSFDMPINSVGMISFHLNEDSFDVEDYLLLPSHTYKIHHFLNKSMTF